MHFYHIIRSGFLISILMFFPNANLKAQYCDTEEVEGINWIQNGGGGSDCNLQVDYVPDEYTTILEIKVNFHFIAKSDINDPQSFTAAGDGVSLGSGFSGSDFSAALLTMINEQRLQVNPQMTLPPGNNTPVVPYPFRLKLKGVYYHQSDQYWGACNGNLDALMMLYGVNEFEEINIFFVASECGGGGYGPGHILLKGTWEGYRDLVNIQDPDPVGTICWSTSRLLLHEIGHSFGLSHTFQQSPACGPLNDNCPDTPSFEEMVNVYGLSNPCCYAPGLCDLSVNCTNNLMDYNCGTSLTPHQLARINRTMVNSKIDYIESSYCVLDESFDLTISTGENVTWQEVRIMKGNIFIESGAVLTIQCTVYMAELSRIYIHTGGKLIIDGGTLTHRCGSYWKGIQVFGNPDAGQNSAMQGVVELKNGAIIEHAEIGILAGQPPLSEGKKTYLKGGGIVKCIGSELRNNVVDIRFAPYLFAPSASYVFDSQLITDEVYSEERLPESHIIMERIKGVKIRGNWFNNEVYEQYTPKTRGIGIRSNTATYEVIPYCTYNINGDCQSSVENRFSNLYQGIQAYSTSLAFPFAVQEAFFENNVGGIAMTGVYGASVTRCDFEVPGDVELPNPNASAFGIYLFGCAGFEIEENNLSRSPNGAQLTSGIAVRESIGSKQPDI
jgi:hypothetical protein